MAELEQRRAPARPTAERPATRRPPTQEPADQGNQAAQEQLLGNQPGSVLPALDQPLADQVPGAVDLQKGGPPELNEVRIRSGDGITLSQDGKAVAKLKHVAVWRGGSVDVVDYEALGSLKTMEGLESGARLFTLLALLSGSRGHPGALRGVNGDVSPRATSGYAEEKMEKALTDAVRRLVLDHYDAVPGLDLRKVLGVKADSQPRA